MPIINHHTPPKRRVLLVTGMHRSATSTLTRICNLLGVRLLGTNLGPGQDNPLGFWEPVEVISAHDALLNELGRAWNDARPLPAGWLTSPAAERCRKRILELVEHDCKDIDVWGLKDPRLCRLLPLWIPIIESLGAKPYILHLFRNPDQVVASLRYRAEMMASTNDYPLSVPDPFRLWLSYVLDAERGSRAYPRAFISYDALLADWRGELTRASERIGFPWPIQPDEAAESVNAFLNEGRQRQRGEAVQEVEQSKIAEAARDLYKALSAAATGNEQTLVEYVEKNDIQNSFEVNQSTKSATDIQQLLQDAATQIQAGRLQEAEALYRSVLTHQPNNPFALHVLGLMKYQAGDAQGAIELLERAITAKPDFAEACSNLATIYAELEQVDKAIIKYQQAIAVSPKLVEAHYNLGAIYQAQNHLDNAKRHYQEALILKPDLVEAREKLAEVSQLIGQNNNSAP